jgi:hypothetical protein
MSHRDEKVMGWILGGFILAGMIGVLVVLPIAFLVWLLF